jgi:hypothetical protein
MAGVIFTSVAQWESFRKDLEAVFDRPIPVMSTGGEAEAVKPEGFANAFENETPSTSPIKDIPPVIPTEITTESLYKSLLPAPDDLTWRGRIAIAHELRLVFAGEEMSSSITPNTKLTHLLKPKTRKARWQHLQQTLEWQLPKLGLPVWAQYAWGFALLAGLTMLFIWPLIGTLLFLGGSILIFPAQNWAHAFPYPTFDTLLEATVRINWPALELGAADDARLRMIFAEIFTRHIAPDIDPDKPFPDIVVSDPWASESPQLHIVNGDALRELFQKTSASGDKMVMRECLVVGPVEPGKDFWAKRKQFIHQAYDAPPAKYDEWVGREMEKLATVKPAAEINLWFENDLFCQVNLWFLMAEIQRLGLPNKIFRIFPPNETEDGQIDWSGFGRMDEAGLLRSFQNRVELTETDLQLGQSLWEAYAGNDQMRLMELAQVKSQCFRFLKEVIQAHIDRLPKEGPGRPEKTLQAIRAEGFTTFEEIFAEFTRREGIYGFGDLQVKGMLDQSH